MFWLLKSTLPAFISLIISYFINKNYELFEKKKKYTMGF